jgi:hypothetical protein
VNPVNPPPLPDDPFLAQAAVFNQAADILESGKAPPKGTNPAFDAVVQKMLDQPGGVISADQNYNAMVGAQARFDSAARNAGYVPSQQ